MSLVLLSLRVKGSVVKISQNNNPSRVAKGVSGIDASMLKSKTESSTIINK